MFYSYFISALVGGEPKPQHRERARVVGLKNAQRAHAGQRLRERKHNSSASTDALSEKEAGNSKFRLWDEGPNFDTDLRQDVTALVGRSAYLTCRVLDRGNKTVSLRNNTENDQILDLPYRTLKAYHVTVGLLNKLL